MKIASPHRVLHSPAVETVDELNEYQAREENALLELILEPAKPNLRLWGSAASIGFLVVWAANRAGRPEIGVAVLLPALFLLLGFRVLLHKPARSVLRFLREGIEIDTKGRFWLRVPWHLITRLVMDGVGGASLDTGTREEGGMSVARLPKAQVDELLAASVLPAHVDVVEAPAATPKHSPKRTFVLWLFLVGMFVVVWQLIQ